MNIVTDKPYTIFRKEYKNNIFYKIGISKKTKEGMYENGYIDIKFKGNPNIPNKTSIYIKNAFLTFYLSKDKHTVPYIVVMEYDTVDQTIKENKTDIEKQDTDDLFAEFGREHKDDDFELPF